MFKIKIILLKLKKKENDKQESNITPNSIVLIDLDSISLDMCLSEG